MINFEIEERTAYIIIAVVVTGLIILGLCMLNSPEIVNFKYM